MGAAIFPMSSVPRFAYLGPAFGQDGLRYNPCRDWIFPSIVRVPEGVPALARYHLYTAPHDAPGGICLFLGDHPEGPWTEYAGNPIVTRAWPPHYEVSHVSSPHVLWREDEGRFFLYYHGENDTTRLATSADGIHFEYERVVVSTGMYEGIREASYARVFRCEHGPRQGEWVMLFMGNNQETRRIYAAWSKDGRSFAAQPRPLINPPPGTEVTQVGAPWYWPEGGRNRVIFHGDITNTALNDVKSHLYVADVGEGFDEEHHEGVFYSREEADHEEARVSDACLFREGEDEWLYFARGGRLCQEVARTRRVR